MTVLVIDLGSSSVRALLFDDAARPIPGAEASRHHSFTTTPPGAATADAAELRSLTEGCIDEALQHPAAAEIAVVGMDTFVGNVLGVDGENQAVTPVFTYADTRSAEDVECLRDTVDVEDAHQRTGCVNHTAYLPGRVSWLRRAEPALFQSVVSWIDFGTYLYRHWFGDAACSYSVASWSGLLNRSTLDWDKEWLQALDLDESRFPRLADYNDLKSGLLPDYASRWPQLRDVPFCLAVGDGAAANVGSGCVDESCIALTVGTTAALRIVTTNRVQPIPSGLWSYRLDEQHHLVGGATTEGGNIFQWAQDTLSLDEDVEAQLARREPDSHGLTFLPLLGGERSPGWSANATGTITGLRLSTTPLDILQAALEGVALRLSLIAEQLKTVADHDYTVIGGGGALVASPAWAQMVANALGRPIQITREPEITAQGVAILALRAVGKAELSDFPLEISHDVQPDENGVKLMQAARDRQLALYEKTVGESK